MPGIGKAVMNVLMRRMQTGKADGINVEKNTVLGDSAGLFPRELSVPRF